MTIVDDTADFFTDVITVRRFVTHDAYGVASSGQSMNVSARITEKIQKMRGVNGIEVVSRMYATMATTASGITVNSHFTLPSRFDPRTPKAVSIAYPTDEDGPLFTRVYF